MEGSMCTPNDLIEEGKEGEERERDRKGGASFSSCSTFSRIAFMLRIESWASSEIQRITREDMEEDWKGCRK
jgi:hypothetical protein